MLTLRLKYLTVVFFSLLYYSKLKCQTYAFNPGTTYITTVDTNSNNFGGIEIQNTGAQNLNLTWKWVSTDTLIDSKFELCNSGICYMNLPASGTMPTIAPGGIGWIKFHMFSGVATGTNTIKYIIKNGSNILDTLIFKIIVSNGATGLKEIKNIKTISMFPNPAIDKTSIVFDLISTAETKIKVMNNIGQVIYYKLLNLNSGLNEVNVDTKDFSAGIYDVIIESENGSVTKKLSVTK